MNKRQFLILGAIVTYFVALASYSICHAQKQPIHIQPAPRPWHVWFQDPASKAVLFQAWADDFTIGTHDGPLEFYRGGQLILRIEKISTFYYQMDTDAPGLTVGRKDSAPTTLQVGK